MKIVKIALPIVIQAAVAWAAIVYVGGPMMRGEPMPWEPSAEEVAAAEEAEEKSVGPLLPMESILVNVAETKGRRFFKTSISLELDGKDLEKSAPEAMPMLRGHVIDILSSKTLDELVTPSSRDSLKSEILETLNAEISGGEFSDLFFTEFLVQ
ncbi:MAG: hypothetical protein HKN12_02905 [Gemmatimonadetes bacterium]|nr:hypothetical protein [Gemmatimonadota bacterium]